MRKISPWLAALFVVFTASDVVRAHGGRYLGPGPLSPPSARPAPGRRPARLAFPPGALPAFSLLDWRFWWELNKDPYLDLHGKIDGAIPEKPCGLGPSRARRPTLEPSKKRLELMVVPLLERVLRENRDREITSSCLVALARIGGGKKLADLFRRYLPAGDRVVSETAVLCLGIAGLEEALPDLLGIFRDRPGGRKLLGTDGAVGFRRRAFAGYALGLLAWSSKNSETKARIFQAAKEILEKSRKENRDVCVSAIQALRLLHPDLSRPGQARTAFEAVRFLLDFLKKGKGSPLVRAHVPAALSKLLGRERVKPGRISPAGRIYLSSGAEWDLMRREAIDFLVNILEKSRPHPFLAQSCVLALGEMGSPRDGDLLRLLEGISERRTLRDLQAGFFAYISLGHLGGAGSDEAVNYLAGRLLEKKRKMDQPWIALGLGVSQAERLLRKKRRSEKAIQALETAFQKTRNPVWRGAPAVALGLARDLDAGIPLRKVMNETEDDSLRGYCALALGMMSYKDALEDLRNLLEEHGDVPFLLRETGMALGLLGFKSETSLFLEKWRKGARSEALLSGMAMAMGFLRDRRVLRPLLDLLLDKKLPPLSRAFAAVALGMVGDKEDLPWNSRIAFGLNYRANVETLTGDAGGILDIL